MSRGSPDASPRTPGHDRQFPGMLLSPILPFGSGLAIGSRDLPPISPRCARDITLHLMAQRGSPVLYAAVVAGWVWMTAWQAAQTTRVLRRLVAMSAAHGGWPDPGSPRLASL